MKKFLIVALGSSALLISLSLAYYLIVFLPQKGSPLVSPTPLTQPTLGIENSPVAVPTLIPSGLCKFPRDFVLNRALGLGAKITDVKEIAEMYDIICNGEKPTIQSFSEWKEIQTSEEPSAPKTIIFNSKQEKETECQRKQSEYTSCLTEYNAKLIEYQNCQMDTNQFKGYCFKPFNNCIKPYCP